MGQLSRQGIEQFVTDKKFQETGVKKISTSGMLPEVVYDKKHILNLRTLQEYFESQLSSEGKAVKVGIDEVAHGSHYRLVFIGEGNNRDPFVDVRYGG